MKHKHVMVVDDDQDIRETLSDVLSDEGYEVYSARNGKEAYDQLTHMTKEELPACILLDLNMPVMDGQEFLHVIHEEDMTSKIPVCVASANRDLETLDLSEAAAVIRKPFDIHQVYQIVHHFCD